MATQDKPSAPLQPNTGEHGVWGYESRAVGGFGESYDAQVAHGAENDEPSASGEDEALSQAVRKRLAHAHVDAADLRVEVRGGVVTLFGSVRSDAEKAKLEAQARTVSGVVSVSSRLLADAGAQRGPA